MSKVTIKYTTKSLNPKLSLSDGTDWIGSDAIVFSNYKKEVLQPLSSMYYGQSVYSNTAYRSITLSFANTSIALEYHNQRRTINAAAAIAVNVLRQQKIDNGEIAAFEMIITMTDENGNETILT